MATKRLPTENRVAHELERILADRMPPNWSLEAEPDARTGRHRIDLLIRVTAPSGERAELAIELKRIMEPRRVPDVVRQIRQALEALPNAVPVVGASYLSPRARQLLDEQNVGYIDMTGNVKITTSSPGLFIHSPGADRDPWPRDSELQSLRGRGAARAVRAIIDSRPPFGVREVAQRTEASLATVSRVLDLLGKDGLVTRTKEGRVTAVDWQGGIRRWAEDYDQVHSNSATTFLEPRGLPEMVKKLNKTEIEYAATGAFAAQRFDPIAPARTAGLYVVNALEAAERLQLRETATGANVVLLEPFDPVVFERTVDRDGLRCVAPSQLAVDLLTGPGREPSQGEEILRWMQENEHDWRN